MITSRLSAQAAVFAVVATTAILMAATPAPRKDAAQVAATTPAPTVVQLDRVVVTGKAVQPRG